MINLIMFGTILVLLNSFKIRWTELHIIGRPNKLLVRHSN